MRRQLHTVVILGALLGLFFAPAWAQETVAPAPYPITATQIAERVMPAVVQVVTEIDYSITPLAWHQSAYDEDTWIQERGVTGYGQRARVMGSGAVIYSGPDPRSERPRDVTYILTNWHVIAYALPGSSRYVERYPEDAWRFEGYVPRRDEDARPDAEIYINSAKLGLVVLPDQNGLIPAMVEWWDESLDAALVRVDHVGGVPTVPLGSSEEMRVGDRIFTAGAPLGIPFALYEGRLAQKNLDLDESWRDMWRYDLAQQPGSSGSPIFNEKGQVVAIVRGSFVLNAFTPVGLEGQHLGVPVDNIKFLLRWNGFAFILGDDDIIARWRERKYGNR